MAHLILSEPRITVTQACWIQNNLLSVCFSCLQDDSGLYFQLLSPETTALIKGSWSNALVALKATATLNPGRQTKN